ncbi:hypothetical protein SUGI_0995730 [Cryptomeria japonica]|nr:hypothetical protein SUGI_0995730 [Cryptomeria japonica]
MAQKDIEGGSHVANPNFSEDTMPKYEAEEKKKKDKSVFHRLQHSTNMVKDFFADKMDKTGHTVKDAAQKVRKSFGV